MTPDVKYPEITVELVGKDGNAFAILGMVNGAMLRAGVPLKDREEFQREAMSGDYNHLLRTVMQYVEVE